MIERFKELMSRGPVLTDGGWGTSLQALGLRIGESADSWNITRPEAVESVARGFVEAGSQIILTNTFGANSVALAQHGLSDQLVEINRCGVETSLRAAGAGALVFGSIGPTRRFLGQATSESETSQAFTEQARILADSGAQGIVIETMTDLREARIALESALETGLRVVACISLHRRAESGNWLVSPTESARTFERDGATVVGANCGVPKEFNDILGEMKSATNLPIWLKPNAGLPQIVNEQAIYSMTPQSFAAECRILTESGAQFIGGCCGISPVHVNAARLALRPDNG